MPPNNDTRSPEEKFRQYIEPLFDKLYAGAYRLTGSTAEADDLMQEALIKAYKNMDKFDESQNPSGWLYTIMRNTFLNNIKKGKNREYLLFDPGMSERVEDKATDNRDSALSEELQSTLNTLPPDMRDILVARETEALSYDDISKSFDIPVGTVKSRLKRARTMLKEKWTRRQQHENGDK